MEAGAYIFRGRWVYIYGLLPLAARYEPGGGPIHPGEEMLQFNFPEEIPALEVPAFFLAGKQDYNTPLTLIEECYEILEAPQKELLVFESSAHTPFLAENDRFNREVIDIKGKVEALE